MSLDDRPVHVCFPQWSYNLLRVIWGSSCTIPNEALLDFVTFLEQRQAAFITQSLALAWAQQPLHVQPVHWAKRLSFVRGFARHRSATDPRTEVPCAGLLPFQPKRAKPYLYSDEEIRNLLRAALDMPHRYRQGALLPWVYYCLFGLLCVSRSASWGKRAIWSYAMSTSKPPY